MVAPPLWSLWSEYSMWSRPLPSGEHFPEGRCQRLGWHWLVVPAECAWRRAGVWETLWGWCRWAADMQLLSLSDGLWLQLWVGEALSTEGALSWTILWWALVQAGWTECQPCSCDARQQTPAVHETWGWIAWTEILVLTTLPFQPLKITAWWICWWPFLLDSHIWMPVLLSDTLMTSPDHQKQALADHEGIADHLIKPVDTRMHAITLSYDTSSKELKMEHSKCVLKHNWKAADQCVNCESSFSNVFKIFQSFKSLTYWATTLCNSTF